MTFTPYVSDPKADTKKKAPKVGPKSYTAEWFSVRKSTLGASAAAGGCGMSRYTQPLEIYNSKAGITEPQRQTKDQRRGHIFESVVLQLYGDKVGGTLFTECPMLFPPEWDFMSATPDALWSPEVIGDAKDWSYSLDYIPVDAKTTRFWTDFGDEGTDNIPQEYVFQSQQQMAVTGATRCDLPVLRGMDVAIYSVARNKDLIEIIRQAEVEMMERIENSDPPEPNWEHPRTYESIRRAFKDVVEESLELDDNIKLLWDESRELAKQKTVIQKEIDAKKAKILYALGDYAVGKLPDGRRLVRRKVNVAARQVPASEYVRLDCKKG